MTQKATIGPPKQKRLGVRWGIRARLIVFVSALFVTTLVALQLVGLFGVPFVSHSGRLENRRQVILDGLNLTADVTAAEITSWVNERLVGVKIVSDRQLTDEIIRLSAGAADARIGRLSEAQSRRAIRGLRGYEAVSSRLAHVTGAGGPYDHLHVTDALTGRVLASNDPSDVGTDHGESPHFSEALKLSKASVSVGSFETTGEETSPVFYASHAVMDGSGRPIAVLVGSCKLDKLMTLHSLGLASLHGEALLVDQDGRLLYSSRNAVSEGKRLMPLESQIMSEPARLTARGVEKTLDSRDYRGRQVIAVARSIRLSPTQTLGLVIEVDKARAFAPVRRDLIFVSGVSLAGILAVTCLTVLVGRNLTVPLLTLSKAAGELANGNSAVRCPIISADEVGDLTSAFNSMAERIQDWEQDLAEQVRVRTAQLSSANERLSAEIAERERIEEQLRVTSEYTRTLIETSLDSLATINADEKITDVNEATVEVTGRTRSVLIGTDFASYFTDPEKAQAGYELAFSQGAVKNYPLAIRHVSGKVTEVLYHAAVYRDHDGNVQGVFAAARDITDRKDAEEAVKKLNEDLRRRTAQLEASNRELEAFSYSASHDLRAPLRSIGGFCRAIEEDYADKLDDKGRDYIRRTIAGTKCMSGLIDELIKLCRVTRSEMSMQTVDLSAMAGEIIEDLRRDEPERHVTVRIAENVQVEGDAVLLRAVMSNLLGNAWKFTGKRPHAEVEFGVTIDNGRHIFYIRDNGAGFDQAYSEKLFVPFRRLHATGEFPGAGVGLATVQRVIQRHAGRIWAEGEMDRGATFFFTLDRPLHDDQMEQETISETTVKKEAA